MFLDQVLGFALKYWGYLALLVPAVVLIYESVVVVGGNEIALIERRWFGKKYEKVTHKMDKWTYLKSVT